MSRNVNVKNISINIIKKNIQNHLTSFFNLELYLSDYVKQNIEMTINLSYRFFLFVQIKRVLNY